MEIKTANIYTNDQRILVECFTNLNNELQKVTKELRELKKLVKESGGTVETNITSKKGK